MTNLSLLLPKSLTTLAAATASSEIAVDQRTGHLLGQRSKRRTFDGATSQRVFQHAEIHLLLARFRTQLRQIANRGCHDTQPGRSSEPSRLARRLQRRLPACLLCSVARLNLQIRCTNVACIAFNNGVRPVRSISTNWCTPRGVRQPISTTTKLSRVRHLRWLFIKADAYLLRHRQRSLTTGCGANYRPTAAQSP